MRKPTQMTVMKTINRMKEEDEEASTEEHDERETDETSSGGHDGEDQQSNSAEEAESSKVGNTEIENTESGSGSDSETKKTKKSSLELLEDVESMDGSKIETIGDRLNMDSPTKEDKNEAYRDDESESSGEKNTVTELVENEEKESSSLGGLISNSCDAYCSVFFFSGSQMTEENSYNFTDRIRLDDDRYEESFADKYDMDTDDNGFVTFNARYDMDEVEEVPSDDYSFYERIPAYRIMEEDSPAFRTSVADDPLGKYNYVIEVGDDPVGKSSLRTLKISPEVQPQTQYMEYSDHGDSGAF